MQQDVRAARRGAADRGEGGARGSAKKAGSTTAAAHQLQRGGPAIHRRAPRREFINAAPAARQELAQRIFEEAKTREVELNAILWTVKSVKTRLHNALKLGNAAAAAVPALNQH